MAEALGDLHHARMRRQYTGKQRSQLLELVASGHATVPEAAARLGVTSSTAYYWLKRGTSSRRGSNARRTDRPAVKGSTGTTFVRLVPSGEMAPVLTVRVGGAEVEIRRGFDGGLLRAVVAALLEGAA